MKNKSLIQREMEIRDEIINSFDKNYLLEAGAGAGKTTIIVERVINHIVKSDINPSNLVVITFTKAAATELAERIQIKALERLEIESDQDTIERLKDVDKIFTGTIHSFCDLILREMPFHADLSPGYEIMEDDEEFHLNIWYNFLRDRELDYKEKMQLLNKFGINYLNLNGKALLALENSDVKFIGYENKDLAFKDLEESFHNIILEFGDLEYKDISRGNGLGKLLYDILEDKGVLQDYLDSIGKVFLTREYNLENLFQEIHKKSSVFNEEERYINFIKHLYDLAKNIWALPYNTCTDFINMVVDYKKENYRGSLTFNELLYRASNLVKTSEEARIHLKNKYKYFYLDESQDTDPMQIELIMHLVDEDSKYQGVKSWYDVKPAPGSLFIVGDPKQSIYRFRRADISIYNQLKEVVNKHGEVVYLDINFRSSDAICDWVQLAFKKSHDEDFGFPENSTEAQAGFKQILSMWDDSLEEGNGEYKNYKDQDFEVDYKYESDENEEDLERYKDLHFQDVFKSEFEGNEEEQHLKVGYKYESGGNEEELERYKDLHLQGVYKYESDENEEEYVADLIYKLKENYIISEKIRENGDYHNIYRKVEFGDIMILTKTNAETGMYLRSLKDRGIPALLAGEKSLGETREVLNLFGLIDALVDHEDNIKIVAALRNSFYLDLETIELFMEEETYLSKFIFDLDAINEIQHSSIKKAFTYINKIVKLAKQHSSIAFVEKLLENGFGIYEVNKDYNPLDLRDANASLRQVVEILKTRETYSIYSLREELKTLVFKDVAYELPIDKEEATGALRIMNIHKAKGLEANIVILAGGAKSRNVFPDTHYVEKNHEDETLGFMKYSSSLRIKGPNEEEKGIKENEFKQAEIDRLLYVAATRAKAVLIVGDTLDEKAFLNPLSSQINRNIELKGQVKREESIFKTSREKRLERDLTRDLRVKKEIYPSTYILSSPSRFGSGMYFGGIERDKEGPIIKALKLKSAKKIEMTPEMRSKFGDFAPRGKFYGSIVHKAIEHLIKTTDNLRDLRDLDNLSNTKSLDSLRDLSDSSNLSDENASRKTRNLSDLNDLRNLIDDKINYSTDYAINSVIDNLEINKTNIGLFYPGQDLKVEKIIKTNIEEGREKAVTIIKNRLFGYVKDVLLTFVNNKNIKELFHNGEEIFVELPFTIALDDRNKHVFEKILNLMKNQEVEKIKKHNKIVLINGVIDLVIKSKEGIWTILDYKTDKPLTGEKDLTNYLKKAYGNQLEAYKLLFEEIVKDENIKVDNLLLYSAYMDKVISINS